MKKTQEQPTKTQEIDFGLKEQELQELFISSKKTICEGGSEGGAG